MKDLNKVKFSNNRAYIERTYKSGKKKGQIRRDYGQIIICHNCKERGFTKDTNIRMGRFKFCSYQCKNQGENNSNWKGGKIENTSGYILIKMPNHPNADNMGYVRQHRLIVEKYLGRVLKPEEVVHHINNNSRDNYLQNLMVFKSNSIHNKFERNYPINPEDIIFDGRKLNETKRCDLE